MYKDRLKMWVFLLLCLNKLVLMATLLADYNSINLPVIEGTQQFIILLEIATFVAGVVLETILLSQEILSTIKRCFINNPQN